MFSVKVQAQLIGAGEKILAGAGVATATAIFGFVFIAVTFGTIPAANALPSFARQTGQPCGTCHTDFPGLTPFGRRFKIEGYTAGGGKYRTTLFPEWKPDPLDSFARDAKSFAGKKSDTGKDGQQDTGQGNTWVPPISMMAIVGYTHTQASQDPTGSPYKSNNNVVVSPVSLFYGGAITEHIGAFAQLTWNNAPFGTPTQADPYATRQVTWDNTDDRYANSTKLGNVDVINGITPNDMPYLELTGYRTINYDAQLKLGPDPFAAPGISQGIMPYWRVALEPHWGPHWLEFGAFGMSARIHPWNQDDTLDSNGFFQNVMYPQTDRYTDTAFDAQYQYQGDNYWFTLRGVYIHEKQTLDATFGNSPHSDGTNGSDNPTNTLNTFRALASLAYGNDNRVVLTGQYFNTKGSSDASLYSGLASQFDPSGTPPTDPNSNGYIFDIAYIPFISSQAPVWPWANMRVGLQYTYYNKFDGDTVFAHDNNTLFGYVWFAM